MKVIDRLPLSLFTRDGGALLRVQGLNKLEAQELARRHGADLMRPRPYSEDKIMGALGVPPTPEDSATEGEPVLVCDVLDYRTIRFYLVERIADASGVTKDGEVILSDGESYEDDDEPDPFEGTS